MITSPVGGIPDIYAGREEIGEMVAPDDAGELARAFDRALRRIATNGVNGARVRSVYSEHFQEAVAHRQFLHALGLDAELTEKAA